ncbi:MAG: hypothetical protein M3O24_00190 [Thermoproteota archaeon]|nr:hypothetical protein [Thermoproteota archaeon]
MAILLDISRAPNFLRTIICNELERLHVKTRGDDFLEVDQEYNRRYVKSFMEDVFASNNVNDFVVAENSESEEELVLFKRGDIEQIGLFICTHCSMLFGSEEERSEHSRAHYFV